MDIQRERIATSCVCCQQTALKKQAAILMPFVAHRVFDSPPVKIDASWGLNSIQTGMAYMLCHSLLCENCGCLFLDLRFSSRELALLYKGYREEAYTALRESYEPDYRHRNEALIHGVADISYVQEFLSPYLKFPVAILDWGGDTGKNTPFKEHNKFLHIYDISDKVPICGAERVDKDQMLITHYDLIVCSHVLEHIPFPRDYLLEIMQIMTSQTVLYIEVPYESLMRMAVPDRLLKKRHWHEHINFYSKEALHLLVQQCGLQIIAFCELTIKERGQCRYVLQMVCLLA